ncbi:hypothetical protein DSECCO2_558290 [anaerobic digester metagenome]
MKTAAVSLILFLIAFSSTAQEYVNTEYSEEYSVSATFNGATLQFTDEGKSYWSIRFTATDGSEATVENYYDAFLTSIINDGTPVNTGKKFIVKLMNVVDYYDDGSEDFFYFGVACTLDE